MNMAQLTVSEKQYFIKRGQRVIDAAIQRVKDGSPNFESGMREAARANVLADLGLTFKYRKYEEAKAALEKAQKVVADFEVDMAKLIPEDVASKYWDPDTRLERGLSSLTEKKFQAMRNASPVGKQINKLIEVRDSIEDAIMISSTSPQMARFIKEIADKYGEVLSETEGMALAIFNSSPIEGPETKIKTAVVKSKAK